MYRLLQVRLQRVSDQPHQPHLGQPQVRSRRVWILLTMNLVPVFQATSDKNRSLAGMTVFLHSNQALRLT